MNTVIIESSGFAEPLNPRTKYVVNLLQGARQIASQARDGAAVEVASLLFSHYVIGLALPGDRIGISDSRTASLRDPVVILVPVSSIDGLLLSATDNGKNFASPMRSGGVWASYYRSHQAIYWASEWRLSPLWQSIILLHEGLHAFQHLAMANPPSTRRAREAAATQLEYRLLMSLGGGRFRELVNVLARNSKTANQQAARQGATARTLDSIFGRPISREDDATRATFVESCMKIARAQSSDRLAA